MPRVVLLGTGKIGRMISWFLVDSDDYQVVVADVDPTALERLGDRVTVATELLPPAAPTV